MTEIRFFFFLVQSAAFMAVRCKTGVKVGAGGDILNFSTFFSLYTHIN